MLKVFLIYTHGQFICFLNAKYLHPNSFIFLLFRCYEHLRFSVVMFQQERAQPFHAFGENVFTSCSLFAVARNAFPLLTLGRFPAWDGTSRGPSPAPGTVRLCPVQAENKNVPVPCSMDKPVSRKGLSSFSLHC